MVMERGRCLEASLGEPNLPRSIFFFLNGTCIGIMNDDYTIGIGVGTEDIIHSQFFRRSVPNVDKKIL